MKKTSFTIVLIILLTIFLLLGCRDSEYNQIRNYIDQIKIVNTHTHQSFPYKPKHNCLDVALYLNADLISAGMPPISDEMDKRYDPEEYWEHAQEYLRFCRATSYHDQFIKNFQQLYGFKSNELTKEDFLELSAQVDSNAKNYGNWLEQGLEKCNIDYVFVDRVWDPFNPQMEHEKFGYVFRFDNLILDIAKTVKEKKVVNADASKLLGIESLSITSIDEYLIYIDKILQKVQDNNVVALKMGLAYHRSLDFKKVSKEKANELFSKQELDKNEITELQDFLVFHIAKRAGQMQLPIQIHTGYLHGNNNELDRGQPIKLLTLLRQFPKTKYVLFHGGYPWTGEFVAIGKNFSNVYLDIVWLPQLSRTRAIIALHEILDAVPYNKITWGGDVGKIDEMAGSLELGKEVVATVLAERIEKGWLSKEVAQDIAQRIFRENAIDIFNLDLDY